MQPALRNRVIGVSAILAGFAGWWYNWHDVKTTGTFSIKLTLFPPLALCAGLLFIFRPEWTGPLRSNSTREHKLALLAAIVFMAVASAIDFYLLASYQP